MISLKISTFLSQKVFPRTEVVNVHQGLGYFKYLYHKIDTNGFWLGVEEGNLQSII